ncbi:MAG TPA: VWA domain-containing protein [Pyrinomonadaceae bacterium]|jgi:VWFA-related protein|nr:VWA domain-containing protein [Pyrinomonadaceae bacterium]
MKQFATVFLFLFALIFLSGTASAQSGRNRASQGADGNGAPSSSSDSVKSSSSKEEGTDASNINRSEEVAGDVLRVETSLVTVPVSVMDRSGKYIPSLTREDFHIFEDGVEQRISYFATVDQPFTVALLMDTSRSTNFKLEDIQEAAIAFVKQLKSEDRVMVVSFDDKINVLTKPTDDRDVLINAIRRTRTGGGTRLYDAVDQVIKQHLRGMTGRKAIVLFTDGVDTTSRHATYESTIREAEELDALAYPVAYDTSDGVGNGPGQQRLPLPGGRGGIIFGSPFPRWPMPGPGGGRGGRGGGGPGGGGSNDEDYRRASAYLHDLADKTGGRYYKGDSLQNISEAFAQIADELRRQYSLGYYPKSTAQVGQRRQIKVRVNQPNLAVSARDSYIYTQKKPDTTQANQQQLTTPQAQGNHLNKASTR